MRDGNPPLAILEMDAQMTSVLELQREVVADQVGRIARGIEIDRAFNRAKPRHGHRRSLEQALVDAESIADPAKHFAVLQELAHAGALFHELRHSDHSIRDAIKTA